MYMDRYPQPLTIVRQHFFDFRDNRQAHSPLPIIYDNHPLPMPMPQYRIFLSVSIAFVSFHYTLPATHRPMDIVHSLVRLDYRKALCLQNMPMEPKSSSNISTTVTHIGRTAATSR